MASVPPTHDKASEGTKKRKASVTPEAEGDEDSNALKDARKLQYWFVSMMRDADFLKVLCDILEKSDEELEKDRERLSDVDENAENQWYGSESRVEKHGDPSLQLLKWIASRNEPSTSFGLSGYEKLLDVGSRKQSGDEVVKEYNERRELLLKVADVCVATAPRKPATGKSTKRVKVEREDCHYHATKPDNTSAKTIVLDKVKLERHVRGNMVANSLRRLQLLLLARLIATHLCNSGSASSLDEVTSATMAGSSAPKDDEKKTSHPKLDAVFPSSDPKSNPFFFGVGRIVDWVRHLAPVSIFEPVGGKDAAADMLDSMRLEKDEWQPQTEKGDEYYACLLGMVYGLPVLALE